MKSPKRDSVHHFPYNYTKNGSYLSPTNERFANASPNHNEKTRKAGSPNSTKFIEELIMQSSPGTKQFQENSQRINPEAINPFTQINQNIESFKIISKNTNNGFSRANSSGANFFQNSQSRKRSILIHKNANQENLQN